MDANNWYVVAKPSSIATIEISFLKGVQAPQVFMKEDFDREVIWYKGRLVFSGAVMDYRGFYGGLVADQLIQPQHNPGKVLPQVLPGLFYST